MSWARRSLKIYHSDFGRNFGWFVERRGKRVAALVDPVWDVNNQFWHIYRLVALSDSPDELAELLTREFWDDPGLVFENREFGARVHGALASGPERHAEGVVLHMRLLSVTMTLPGFWKLVDGWPFRPITVHVAD
jgi:hypothetical protein